MTAEQWLDAEIDHAIACGEELYSWSLGPDLTEAERRSLRTAAAAFMATAIELDEAKAPRS